MPLWEGILASFCAGVAVSVFNRFGLSQIKTPCEKRREAAKNRSDFSSDDSSDDSSDGGHTGAISAAALCHVHSHGA